MKYRFHKCRPHAKCPDLTGWYLELLPDDVETLMKLHKGVVGLYFFKFGQDSHVDPTGPYNPIKLAALWLQSVERYLLRGETVLVNMNGGMMPMDVPILDTVESDDLHWDDRFDDEYITISRWPQAKHWYLSSNKNRVFVPVKYDSYTETYKEALRYAPANRIHTKECAGIVLPE